MNPQTNHTDGSRMTTLMRVIAPLLLLVLGAILTYTLVNTGPKMKKAPPKIWKLPGVKVISVTAESITIPVSTRGLVHPTTKIQLTSEVSGVITKVSPKLVNGAYFKKGEMLLKINPSHYEAELNNAKANVASAKHHLVKTKAATRTSDAVDFDIERSDLAKGKPQMREAQAKYTAALSAMRLAKRSLENTTIIAPFDGRVASKLANIKEHTTIGKPVAEIYAIDSVELRLPLSEIQMALVDIPQRYSGESISGNEPNVILEDTKHQFRWHGKINRSEGSVDPRNRLTFVVARVEDPYARDPEQPGRPPLTMGSFVEATIQGIQHNNIFSVPRKAIHNMNEIWTLDDENRLHVKNVDILYRGKDRIYVKEGLEDNERVILTPMKAVVENMEVAITSELEPLSPILTDDLFGPVQRIDSSSARTSQINTDARPAAKTTVPELTLDPEIMSGMMGMQRETDI